MEIRVTRGFIIRAIRDAMKKKVLAQGSWVRVGSYIDASKMTLKECSVCAVGAVFKAALNGEVNGEMVGDHINDALRGHTFGLVYNEHLDATTKQLIEGGYYLNALSVVFESTNSGEKSIEFVKKHFPPTVEIDIDGFKARAKVLAASEARARAAATEG